MPRNSALVPRHCARGGGWMSLFRAVEERPGTGKNGCGSRATAGVMLMDQQEPWKMLGMSHLPILEPETPYECTQGYRNSVIFPTALLEESGEVKIYYGATDCFVCMAPAALQDLLALCKPS